MDIIITSYFAAFLLGLFSTVHCIAMCGSVIGALTFSLPVEVRESQRRMLPYVLNYNLGRILSYTVAGTVVGLLSTPLMQLNLHSVLQGIAVLIMIGMGLYLAGWFPYFARVERIGGPVWRKIQPLGQRFLPVRKKSHALFLGAIWGWLPCGLVYAVLAVAATSGEALKGGMVMLMFGAGTLPAVMGAGLFAGMLASIGRSKMMRRIAGILIIVMAIVTLIGAFYESHAHHHDGPQRVTHYDSDAVMDPPADSHSAAQHVAPHPTE